MDIFSSWGSLFHSLLNGYCLMQPYNLQQHIASFHKKERPFKCSLSDCSATFSTKASSTSYMTNIGCSILGITLSTSWCPTVSNLISLKDTFCVVIVNILCSKEYIHTKGSGV